MTLESAVGADVGIGVGVGVGTYGGNIVNNVGDWDTSARVTYGVNAETSRAETVTLERVVGAAVGVGVGVGVGAYGGSVVIEAGSCDASARLTCLVNDET